MMKFKRSLAALAAISVLTVSCGSHREAMPAITPDNTSNNMTPATPGQAAMLAPVVVYKTTGNFDNLVPVTLDPTGTRVMSYPAPSDIGKDGNYSTPVKLDDGYLLDRRGISANTVFTDYTYEQYAALDAVPTSSELMHHVKHRQPFAEMYLIKGVSNPSVRQLNEIIDGGFKNCIVIINGNTD